MKRKRNLRRNPKRGLTEEEKEFLEELKKKSEAGSIQDTYEGRLKKIESIIEGVVN